VSGCDGEVCDAPRGMYVITELGREFIAQEVAA
jgi:hypothetical protein